MATPPRQTYFIPPIPSLPSPSGARKRGSFSSSFSFDPTYLVHSYMDANANQNKLRSNQALDPNRSMLAASPLRSSPHRLRKGKETAGDPHPLAQDTTADVFPETDVEEESYDYRAGWTMVDRMRLWRHDAIWQHLYETAAFWGDKVLSWTNDKNDAFWLAQIYFQMHQYSRAERLLTRPFHEDENENENEPPMANGHSYPNMLDHMNIVNRGMDRGKGKGKGKVVAGPPPPRRPYLPELAIPGIDVPPPFRIPGGTDIITERAGGSYTLVDLSVACRYLAAQCQIRQGKWAEATEMLGESNPFRGTDGVGPRIANIDGGVKIEASMCYLRGLLKLKLNRGESAKESFMEALALDVKCYEAFDQLISGEMMTADEEWEFVQSLAYKQQIPEDAEFVRLIYTSRLRKYKHAEEHALIRQQLVEEFNLKDNVDVLYSFADAAYTQFKWMDCFTITQRILSLVNVHEHTMPLHIACMHHLPHLHPKLFILAHELVEKEPEAAMSWYAVGVWYLSSKKWAEARTYFSKTSLMDPRFAPAWIAFAHTFAFEGEHDHAVTAYSTCARLFTGSHLPLMFVGMEHIMLSNYDMADEALNAADKMCNGDPLLYNERGVMAFNRGNYESAVSLFQKALEISDVSQGSHSTWATTYVNLGSALGKLGRYQEACESYRKVLDMDPRHTTALAFMGKTYMLMGRLEDAIQKFHESLSVDPVNGHVVELLNLALEASLDHAPPLTSPASSLGVKAEEFVKSASRQQAIKAAKVAHSNPSWRDPPIEEGLMNIG
ncbi:CUT9 [Sanghuangporus vaninii]